MASRNGKLGAMLFLEQQSGEGSSVSERGEEIKL